MHPYIVGKLIVLARFNSLCDMKQLLQRIALF